MAHLFASEGIRDVTDPRLLSHARVRLRQLQRIQLIANTQVAILAVALEILIGIPADNLLDLNRVGVQVKRVSGQPYQEPLIHRVHFMQPDWRAVWEAQPVHETSCRVVSVQRERKWCGWGIAGALLDHAAIAYIGNTRLLGSLTA